MGFDFLIIGGGAIGLGIARELRRRGAGEVAVVERGRVGAEASWAAAGMLAPNAETHEDGPLFRFCTDSNALYPEFAAQLLEETGVDVELDRAGTFALSFTEDDDRLISEKFEWQIGAGIAVERLSREEILAAEPNVSPLIHGGLFYPNDWQVENRKLVEALRRSCEVARVRIFDGTEVTGLLTEGTQASGVSTPKGELEARTVIVANGAWASGLIGGSAIRPIRGQMASLAGPGGRPPRAVVYGPNGYIVPRSDGRVLVGATVEDAGFRKEVLPESINGLRDAAVEIAPVLARFDINEAWAGLRPMAADGLPVIGPLANREGVFAATGHYRNGILLAPMTAKVVADAILTGETPEYIEAFRPDRFSATAAASNR